MVKAVTEPDVREGYVRSHLSVRGMPRNFNSLHLIRGLMMDLAFVRSQKAKEPMGRNLFFGKYREGAKTNCG